MNETSKNIHQRMHAVMATIGYVQKEDKQVNGQYRFVGHDAVTAKVRGALLEHGILTIPTVTKHVQDGNRTEVDMTIAFVNVDDPQDRIEVQAFGYGIDPQDKGPGKAVSYAVKYAYLKAFALETGDDPERDSIDHEPAKKPNTATQVAHDEFDRMPPDEQQFLREKAMELIALCESDQGDVVAYLDGLRLQADEKLALWSQLPSKTRTFIKKAQEVDKASKPKKPTPADYAMQA